MRVDDIYNNDGPQEYEEELNKVHKIAGESKAVSSDEYLIDGTSLIYHPDYITDMERGQWWGSPFYLEVSPVGYCNHRCTFCAVDYLGYKMKKLDRRVLRDFLMGCSDKGTRSVMFAGEGEPMLHPEFAGMVMDAGGAGLDVAITTNATSISREFLAGGMEYVTWIKASINGGCAEDYARIHKVKPGVWDKVWENMNKMMQIKNTMGLSTAIGVQAVVLPDNVDNLEGLIHKASSMGLDYVVLKPYSHNPASKTKKYKNLNYGSIWNQITEEFGGKIGNTNIIVRKDAMAAWDKGVPKFKHCHATPYLWSYIMSTGDVYGCSAHLNDTSFRLGHYGDDVSEVFGLNAHCLATTCKETLDISECRVNCRMARCNEYLERVINIKGHDNFI